MARPARVVPRAVFDARLVAAACAAGAVLRRHTVRSVDVRPDRVVLDGDPVGADAWWPPTVPGPGAAPAGLPVNDPGHLAVAIRGYAPVRRTSPASSGSPSGARTGRSTPGPSPSATAAPTSATAPCCAGAGS